MTELHDLPELRDLPELGVGFVYWPSLARLLEADLCPIDVLEIEPQPFWFPPDSSTSPYRLDQRAFDQLREIPQPKLVHGVGFPVGGTVAPEARQLSSFVESINALQAPWASEHLSFNRVRGNAGSVDVGFLLPPLQNPGGVALATENITALKAQLPVPFAFETGVSYLKPLPGEISDGAFFAAVAQQADCGILLDLHNVWANERNGRQSVLELVDELPLDRVLEVHLAGGQEYQGYWVDAHSNLVPSQVMELAGYVIARLPNLKAIIYEVMPEYVQANGISDSQLADQLWALRELWRLRGTRSDPRPQTDIPVEFTDSPLFLVSPRAWEDALSAAVTGAVTGNDTTADPAVAAVFADPGTNVLAGLIRAVRSGKVADTLSLTTRLLLLSVGEQGLDTIFGQFWKAVPSEQMSSDEAVKFAGYLASTGLAEEIPYLSCVANFELAAHQAVMTGRPQRVSFGVQPEPLLLALRQGRLPAALEQGDFTVTVSPP